MSAQEELEKLEREMRDVGTNAMDGWADHLAAIREGLGKAQEPVRWMCPDHGDVSRVQRVGWLPLYREAPPADSAQVLVDAQWREQCDEMRYDYQRYQDGGTMPTITTQRPATMREMQDEIDRMRAAHAAMYDEAERLREQLHRVTSIAYSLSAGLCMVAVVEEKDGYDLIRRESVMDLVMRWRMQHDASTKQPNSY